MAVILNLGGLPGDKDVGDPVEYEHLWLVQVSDVIEMKVFNRGIALLVADDEKMKRIHRVPCKVDERKERGLADGEIAFTPREDQVDRTSCRRSASHPSAAVLR